MVVYTFLLDHVKRNDNADRRFKSSRGEVSRDEAAVRAEEERVPGAGGEAGPLRGPEPAPFVAAPPARLGEIRTAPQHGARPALVRDLKDYVESRGATFILVLWTNRHSMPPGELAGGLFPGIKLNVIDTGAGASAAWDTFHIPGEYHPDARAHARVARLLADKFQGARPHRSFSTSISAP